MSCGVDRRHRLDLVLLGHWHRLAAAAPMRPLAWEPPYAARAALEKVKMTKKKKKFSLERKMTLRSSHRGSVVNESD